VPDLTKKQKARQNNIASQQPNTTRAQWKARTASEQVAKGTQHTLYTKREKQQKQSEEVPFFFPHLSFFFIVENP
jgi:hypothetical protein